MSQKSLTDMARALRRARMPIKRPSTQTQNPSPATPPEDDSKAGKPVYGHTLDSWEPRYRPSEELTPRTTAKPPDRAPVENAKPVTAKSNEKAKKVPEILEVDEEEENETGFIATTRTAKRMIDKKARTTCLSISVSKEEARILRQHASEMNTTFSLWARSVLFRAAGRRMPARPKRVE